MEKVRTKVAALAFVATVVVGAGVLGAQVAQAHEGHEDRTQAREERLQERIDDGTISEERAAEIRERLAIRDARHEARHAARQARVEGLANTFGTTPAELRTELRSGASLADLAAAAGIDLDAIVDQLMATRLERIEAKVADGSIDQATADERIAAIRERVEAIVNGERPGRGHDGRNGN